MKRTTILAAGFAGITAIAAAAAFAHGPGGRGGGNLGAGPAAGGSMMGHGMTGGKFGGGTGMMGHGMTGGQFGGGTGMMGHGMTGGMMATFDADGDGTVTPDELAEGLTAKLGEYDADGSGTLSLDEFEALHTDHIRPMTVDRFQFLDSDGDGEVTGDEITFPAQMMERVYQRHQQMQQMPMNTPRRRMNAPSAN